MKIELLLSFLLLVSLASAENIDSIVQRNQKAAKSQYPVNKAADFSALQIAAIKGDANAQEKLLELSAKHIQTVYGILGKQGGLLFSTRRLISGYDTAQNNYAVNLIEFFEATADKVSVKKKYFDVTAQDGAILSVSFLTYKPVDKAIEVKKDGKSTTVALADLCEADQKFIIEALEDEQFESSSDLVISSEDSQGEGSSFEKEKRSGMVESTGEKVTGNFVVGTAKEVFRKIIIENKGSFPLENLVIEHQSFAEQKIMKRPKDFPENYRYSGFIQLKSLAPGERKEIEIKLPQAVTAKQTTVSTANTEYYIVIPSDCNQQSEGRMGGIWVKVHRFTPYGQRLTREYKSAGVPDVEWANVAPSSADIR